MRLPSVLSCLVWRTLTGGELRLSLGSGVYIGDLTFGLNTSVGAYGLAGPGVG